MNRIERPALRGAGHGAEHELQKGVLAEGIAGGGPEAMWRAAANHAGEHAGAETVCARLEAAHTAPPASFSRSMGWVLTAFQKAVHDLLSGATFEETLATTAAQGGDADTNAAICGALLGAAMGRKAIPLRWRNGVLTCRSIAAPAVRHSRPACYWPDDALELAEALLDAGALPDLSGPTGPLTPSV